MIGYLECFSGVSGDKFLGALVDAGVTVEALRHELSGLRIGEWSLSAERVGERGIAATRVRVEAGEPVLRGSWREIREELVRAPMREDVRARSLDVFAALAEAEGRVHSRPADEVHFHEVGAIDSIIDIVGVAAGLALLGIDDLTCSPVATGWGTVRCEHGVLPVPAPATAELLVDVPTVPGPCEGELTTPTGAALVRTLASAFGPPPAMTPESAAYGAGTRELDGVPNVLRLTIGEAPDGGREVVAVLETTVDHLSPETRATAIEAILADGAIDAWQTPVVMKKGRLASNVTVLAPLPLADEVSSAVLRLTGSLGVRRHDVTRAVAGREERVLDTSLGPVRFKLGGEGWRRVRPENSELARLAAETGIAPDVLAARLSREAEDLLAGS